MRAQFSQLHWVRVLLTGVLIVILVIIINTVLPVIGWVWHTTDRQLFYQVVTWSTTVLALLLIVGGTVWVARKVERAAPLHGLLVGLVAALILLPLGKASIDLAALVIFVLMVAVGWLGGVLGSRGRRSYRAA